MSSFHFSRGARSLVAAGAVVALGITGAFLPVGAAPASAAAGCYDQGCFGQDPYAMGCVDDAVMASLAYINTPTGTGRVEHWHSPACMADWATTRIYSGPHDAAHAGIYPQGRGGIHGRYSTTVRYDLYTYPWVVTDMIAGSVVNCAVGNVREDGSVQGTQAPCA